MTTTLLMTAYQRAHLLPRTIESIQRQTLQPDQIILVEDGSDGITENLCRDANIEYYCRRNRTCVNIPIPWNIGIRHATGDILVLQNAEIFYEDNDALSKIIAPVVADPLITSVPKVRSLTKTGEFETWYIHPDKPRTNAALPIINFCQALRMEWAVKIGGFDEEYKAYGLDDDDFQNRLWAQGVRHTYADTVVTHQWHEHCLQDIQQYERNVIRYNEVYERVKAGEKIIANIGHYWGDLNS